VRPAQTVYEMVEEVLNRQAKALVAQTGQPFEAALEDVTDTEAGRQLRELTNCAYHEQRAAEWQASLPRRRSEERRHYYSTWLLENYVERLEGQEARAEYHALLEELASLRG
jgi:hypothetical protein